MMHLPFVDGSGRSASINFQLDTLQNMYLENRTMEGAKSPKALVRTAGTRLFYDFGDGPSRGQLSIEGYDFTVSAGNVWQKDTVDTVTLLGTVADDGRPVKMVANNQYVFGRSAGRGFAIVYGAVVDEAAFLTDGVAGPPWTKLADIEFLHGYYIALDDDGSATGGQFFISSLNNPTLWAALDFATVPSSADKLRALAVSHDQLYVIGSVITQPFYDSGNADFPLVPNQSGAMQVGTLAKDSVCSIGVGLRSDDNVIYFLSETPNGHCQLVKLVGFNPVVVSTPPIESEWQLATPSDVENVVLWTFQENGHLFVQVCWPQSSSTPLGSQRYDSTTDRWANVSWLNPATGLQEAHRGINHAFNLSRHLVGDRLAGILWEMSTSFYDDRDPAEPTTPVPMVAYRECLLPSSGTKNMFISRIELLGETGVGLPNLCPITWTCSQSAAAFNAAVIALVVAHTITVGQAVVVSAAFNNTACYSTNSSGDIVLAAGSPNNVPGAVALGLGLTAKQVAGYDPQVLLEISGNAGHTYDPNPEQISMGKSGEYDVRMVWVGIGSFRQPALRISSDAPVKTWWYGLDIQITEGVS